MLDAMEEESVIASELLAAEKAARAEAHAELAGTPREADRLVARDMELRATIEQELRVTLGNELKGESEKSRAQMQKEIRLQLEQEVRREVEQRVRAEHEQRSAEHERLLHDKMELGRTPLMELLKEKRQAVISHAVTQGLNPRAPLKPSGIEWLGDVPEHWQHASLTRIASRVVVGIAEAATHAYADVGVPILRSTNIRPGKIIGEILHVEQGFADDRGSKLIEAGDLVTVRTGNAGVTAVVPPDLDGCQCFTMLITTLNKGYLPEYYCYWMNSIPAQCYFSLEGWGTAQVNISVPILKELPVPMPPTPEQEAIVSYLDRETGEFDALAAEAQKAIDLLQERRTALISAAVTGQIDVRKLAAA